MLIYFVEDDKNISYVIEKTIEKMRINKQAFNNGKDFIEAYNNKKPDLIMLDIMLPDTSGIELLKYIRKENKEIPIIIVSVLFNEMDKVIALDSGADDYITKPFGILELTSRIQAKLRKVKSEQIIFYGDIKIDLKKYKVYSNDNELILTNKEFDILKYIIKNKDKVITKESIFHHVWNTTYMGETRALDMHVKSLRDKMKKIKSKVKIKTIYGVGYKIGVI